MALMGFLDGAIDRRTAPPSTIRRSDGLVNPSVKSDHAVTAIAKEMTRLLNK